MANMSHEEMKVVEKLRDRIADLNNVLTEARQLGLTVDIDVSKQEVVGSRAPVVMVTGRATRARIEIDVRL